MGSVAVLGIVDSGDRCGRCRSGFEHFYSPSRLLSNTVSSETGLVTVEVFEFARKGPP